MTEQEQINRDTAAFYRMLFLLKMMHHELEFMNSGGIRTEIKTILVRGKNNYEKVLLELIAKSHPTVQQKLREVSVQSDDKIRAISTILEKLSHLTDEEVENLEDQFNALLQIDYSGAG